MKDKNIYTSVKLDEGERMKCDFCPEIPDNPNATWQLKTRNIQSNKAIDRNFLCPECKFKYDNKQLKKCSNCGKFKIRGDENRTCQCFSEEYEKIHKEIDPETYSIKLEKQIHELTIQKDYLEESHFEVIKVAENWDSRKELIEKNEELGKKSRGLSDKNKFLKSRIEKLETQLLGVEETNKKARRLSDENRILRGEIEALSTEVEKYKGENSELKSGISQIKSDVLETEAKIEKLLSGTELQAQIEIFKN